MVMTITCGTLPDILPNQIPTANNPVSFEVWPTLTVDQHVVRSSTLGAKSVSFFCLFGKSMGCFLSCTSACRPPWGRLCCPGMDSDSEAYCGLTLPSLWSNTMPLLEMRPSVPLLSSVAMLDAVPRPSGIPWLDLEAPFCNSWWISCTMPLISAAVTRMNNYPTEIFPPEHERWTYQCSAFS
jgi:hypothetical protein